MLNALLEKILDSCGAASQEEVTEYLRSLQGPAKSLWESYRNPDVAAHYETEDVQNAYLLRYYPFYSYLLSNILNRLQCENIRLVTHDLLSATFFGCGPAPELAGFLRFLREAETGPQWSWRILLKFIDERKA